MTLLLFLFWLILNGRVTIEIVLVGAVVSTALTWVSKNVLHIMPQEGVRLVRYIPGAFLYVCYLGLQLLRSNFHVMRLILSPKCQVQPRLMWFEVPYQHNATKAVLANSITLTPGTVTVSLRKDLICVYGLRPEFTNGLKDSGFFVKLQRLEGGNHG